MRKSCCSSRPVSIAPRASWFFIFLLSAYSLFSLCPASANVRGRCSSYGPFPEDSASSVVVVGGGCSLKKHANGHMIDSFSKVIRVNQLRTEGFEEYVGKRSDFILSTFATNFSAKEYDSVSPSQIYMSAGEHFGDMDFLRRRVVRFKPEELTILDNYYFSELRDLLQLSDPIQRASTGMVAIYWAVRNFPSKTVYVTGLDFNSSCPHYYEDSSDTWERSISKYHDFKREAAHLWTLAVSGVIKVL